jgi:hypothetical protein
MRSLCTDTSCVMPNVCISHCQSAEFRQQTFIHHLKTQAMQKNTEYHGARLLLMLCAWYVHVVYMLCLQCNVQAALR